MSPAGRRILRSRSGSSIPRRRRRRKEGTDMSNGTIEFIPEEEAEEQGWAHPEFRWTSDPDEHRRAFIFSHMGNADIEAHTLVRSMQAVFEWLKSGTVPRQSVKRKTPLTIVDS